MHISVLLDECINGLNLKEDSFVIDCTLGYGGHSSEILKKIKSGFLFAFDQDKDAIKFANDKLSKVGSNYKIINDNFVNLSKHITTKVDGILFDLGVSSPQLDCADRGFSFHQDARLDMRMNRDQELDAYKVVNTYSASELTKILLKYGDEKFAGRIASKIVDCRKNNPIETTLELVEIIKSAVPKKYMREHHPARKTFQAIRIEVNNELIVFEKALRDALKLLKVNGRLCVITFHSLEDRICKNIFNEVTSVDEAFKNMPVIPCEYQAKFKKVKTIEPSSEELNKNSRSRSAKLRIIERIGE